jgi:hypothetical protein
LLPFVGAQLRLAKYRWKLIAKYRQRLRALCIHLRQQLRLSLHLNLNLDLRLDLHLSLRRAFLAKLLKTLLRKKLAPLFGSMFESMLVWPHAPTYLALRRQRLLGRQPVGRGVGGRIVVLRPANTIRCGADIEPSVYVRMIIILITRLYSSDCVASLGGTARRFSGSVDVSTQATTIHFSPQAVPTEASLIIRETTVQIAPQTAGRATAGATKGGMWSATEQTTRLATEHVVQPVARLAPVRVTG